MYKTIELSCKILTPMFMSGANPQQPEFRAPSFKGIMRFWWRALNGHLAIKTDNGWDYSKLYEKENEIFGNGGEKAKKSKVSIVIGNKNFKELHFNNLIKEHKLNDASFNYIKYIGFGLYDFKSPEKDKKCIEGECTILIKYNLEDEDELELIKTLSAINLFGCLGSKSRNGFGSIELKTTNIKLLSKEELLKEIKNNEPTPFPSFITSTQQKVITLKTKISNELEALAEIGKRYQKAKRNLKLQKTNFDACREIKILGYERCPKKIFFSVKRDENNKYFAQALFLPIVIVDKNSEFNQTATHRFNDENSKILKQLSE